MSIVYTPLCILGAAGKKELNGIGEDRDDMSDGEGDRIEDEGEFAAQDWRVRAGPGNKPTRREREEHEATHMPFRDWCAYCMMGRGRTHHHIAKQKSEDESRRPIIAMDYFLHENGAQSECPIDPRRIELKNHGQSREWHNLSTCWDIEKLH